MREDPSLRRPMSVVQAERKATREARAAANAPRREALRAKNAERKAAKQVGTAPTSTPVIASNIAPPWARDTYGDIPKMPGVMYNKGGVVAKKPKGHTDYRKTGTTLYTKHNTNKKK